MRRRHRRQPRLHPRRAGRARTRAIPVVVLAHRPAVGMRGRIGRGLACHRRRPTTWPRRACSSSTTTSSRSTSSSRAGARRSSRRGTPAGAFKKVGYSVLDKSFGVDEALRQPGPDPFQLRRLPGRVAGRRAALRGGVPPAARAVRVAPRDPADRRALRRGAARSHSASDVRARYELPAGKRVDPLRADVPGRQRDRRPGDRRPRPRRPPRGARRGPRRARPAPPVRPRRGRSSGRRSPASPSTSPTIPTSTS